MAASALPLPAFHLHLPRQLSSGVIFASPHSGSAYLPEFLNRSVLDLPRLRSSEDAFVNRLLASVPAQGATLIEAVFPRAYLDLNRAPDELDPALIEGLARSAGGPRVAAGLGVIPRVVAGGRAIYAGKLTLAEAEERIARIWQPYHAQLQALLQDRRSRFGQVLLLDMHSMPADALGGGQICADIVLGDRFGSSASAVMTSAVEAIFTAAGFRVARNTPFAGAYVASRYGRPAEGVQVVQVEICRSLYMDEKHLQPRADFAAFSARIQKATALLSQLIAEEGRMAAE